MQHISTTPFGRRAVSSGLLAARAMIDARIPDDVPDKWTLMKDLTDARAAFGVTDRDLAVLNALISFHPETDLSDGDGTIVFPSNAALSRRAHGMAESTLRRHLAALVRAGLVLRHDSPNGKRYAVRDRGGDGFAVAFGFDLRPLLVRSAEIRAAADAARAAEERRKRLREAAVLRLRDAAKLVAYGREELGGSWDALEDRCRLLQRALRRKLDADALDEINCDAVALLEEINTRLDPQETEEMIANDINSGRHLQYSNKDSSESELCQEKAKAAAVTPEEPAAPPALPLYLVLRACPDLRTYLPDTDIRDWHHLAKAADFVRPMLGISAHAWQEAYRIMGPSVAAITLVCILQRASQIHSPGGYLRSLTEKAANDAFSPGPMVMALLRTENVVAS